jgi:hypothetical protein
MHKLAIILALILAGCSQPLAEVTQPEFLFGTRADPSLAGELSKLNYPKDAKVGPDLDMLALKKGDTIAIVNRTTLAYKDVQLWVNQQYVAKVNEIAIGINPSISLDNFINRYGEAFPVGGLLNPDKSYPIVLLELVQPAGGDNIGLRQKVVVREQ